MRTAICPGSYDPVTNGHIDIFERAAKLFDRVTVCVTHNSSKNYMFSVEERMDQIRRVTRHIPNVDVTFTEEFIAVFAQREGYDVIVKGLRNASDFEGEFLMNVYNKRLGPKVETVFVPSDEKYVHLSSSAVRELALFGADLTGYIPDELISEVMTRINERRG